MKTITFYSYKGGVGRSLALSNIAIRLSELKKKVCVLDFDLEAPGLQFKFNNYTPSKEIEKGIVDYIDEFTTNQIIPKSIKDFSIDLLPPNNLFEKIQLIPAGNIDNPLYWKKLSGINWSSMFYEEESRGVEFFLDLKHKIETELQPDFLLIDSRTGITDIAGITLKLLADEAVILAANNQENLYGSKKIIKSLVDDENNLFGKTPQITFILTRLPYKDTAKDRTTESLIVRRRIIEIQNEIPAARFETLIIHSDRRLEESERELIGDDYEEKSVSISNDYLKLFDHLTINMLSEVELLIFKNKKRAEKEYIIGLKEIDISKKIAHFAKAIELDKTKFIYFYQIGLAYNSKKDLLIAKQNLEKALILKPDSIDVLNELAWINIELEDLESALTCAKNILTEDSLDWRSYLIKANIFQKRNDLIEAKVELDYAIDNLNNNFELDFALNNRADLLRILNNYEMAYKDIFRAIEINPELPIYFATLAEIYASEGKTNEFYLNLNIALSKGITAEAMRSAKDVYEKFKDEEKFIALMAKYSIDMNEIFNEE